MWDEAVVKELKSLQYLAWFKMVSQYSGANIIQSTWAFKRKIYPDGEFKKYKNGFVSE